MHPYITFSTHSIHHILNAYITFSTHSIHHILKFSTHTSPHQAYISIHPFSYCRFPNTDGVEGDGLHRCGALMEGILQGSFFVQGPSKQQGDSSAFIILIPPHPSFSVCVRARVFLSITRFHPGCSQLFLGILERCKIS